MSPPQDTEAEWAHDIVLASFGAVTSIGLNARMSVASLRAGLNRFMEQDALRDDTHGDPIVLALQPTLDESLRAEDRMVELAVEAALEALVPWLSLKAPAMLPLIMAVPPPQAGASELAGAHLTARIAKRLPVRIDPRRSHLFDHGNAAGGSAVLHAMRLLRKREASACLVGGVDSPRQLEHLHALDADGRLKRPGRSHGFVPGEGAGFLLLCRSALLQREGWKPLAHLLCASEASEPHPWGQPEPTQGEGLTDALWSVLRGPRGAQRADMTWCDLNGEPWRADEWGFAYLRTGKHHGEPLELWHPSDCWGDVGAASVPLLTGAAALALGWAREERRRTALVWAASESEPHRTACLLEREEL